MNKFQACQDALLDWYRKHRRALPWRGAKDPYRIWVSELMLQQTQVAAVIPYYQKFIRRFPTLQALSAASEEQVLKVWEGLGYYRRARYLREGAVYVLGHFGGKIPNTYEGLRSIPGIGDYTAGALLSIAFNRPVPALDGNAMRVLSRFFAFSEDVSVVKNRNALKELALSLMPKKHAGAWTQALMELGAVVCLPKKPKCLLCPLAPFCRAHRENQIERYPVRGIRAKVKALRAVGAVLRSGAKYLLRRRKSEFLKGLYEFPWWEIPVGRKHRTFVEGKFASDFGIGVQCDAKAFYRFTQVYSHRKITMSVYRCRMEKSAAWTPKGARWFRGVEALASVPLSAAQHKIILALRRKAGSE